MSVFAAYMKKRLAETVLFACFAAVMAAVLALNAVPAREIFYGISLLFFVAAVFAAADAWRWCARYRMLQKRREPAQPGEEQPGYQELELGCAELLSELAVSGGDAMESAYQDLLRSLLRAGRERRNEELKRRREMKEYYGMWVHQIKTPIAALRLLLQAKNSEGAADEELAELFYIEQYVGMALQYLRLDSESTDFVFERICLDDVIREAVHKYARQFVSRKIRLDFEAADAVVLSDEKWMEFVVEQILSNAIKYTPGGSISIRAERISAPDGEEADGEWRLVIADTGIGIRAEDLPRICEKGYTGYNGHADKSSTGIGLYLCSRILKKLGHVLSISSEEGRGTQVSILFQKNSNLTKV